MINKTVITYSTLQILKYFYLIFPKAYVSASPEDRLLSLLNRWGNRIQKAEGLVHGHCSHYLFAQNPVAQLDGSMLGVSPGVAAIWRLGWRSGWCVPMATVDAGCVLGAWLGPGPRTHTSPSGSMDGRFIERETTRSKPYKSLGGRGTFSGRASKIPEYHFHHLPLANQSLRPAQIPEEET